MSAREQLGHYPFLNMDILKRFFTGHKYEYIFTRSFSEIAYTIDTAPSKLWNPSRGGRIYNAVGHVQDVLNNLYHSYTGEIQYLLGIMQDMYIPLMLYMEKHDTSDDHLCADEGEGAPIEKLLPKHAFHEGMLPDNVADLMKCSFWSDNGKMDPIVHLLSKSTPQRCQIRSLTLIMLNYCKLHDNVYDFVTNALKCSMLGAYRGAHDRPFKSGRKYTIRSASMTRKDFLVFMQNRHQQLLFFTIKEYLIFAAKHIPALYSELEVRYKWKDFEKRVTSTMNTVRSMLTTDDLMKFIGVERYLTSVTRLQPHLYRPRKHAFCRVIMHECEHHDDTLGLASGRYKHWQLMYDMLIRVPLAPMPVEWLYLFNMPHDQVETLKKIQQSYNATGIRGNIRAFIKSLEREHFEIVRALARAYDRKINVRMFTLPTHITVRQIRALRQMHNVPNGEEMHHTIGKTLVCMECQQFKGFVAYKTSKKVHNIHAYGQTRVLVDDDTGKMYCGKKNDKIDKKRDIYTYDWEQIVQGDERQERKTAKDKRKEATNNLCKKYELQRINLIGNMLQFYGTLYTICPQCANFMKYDPKNMYNGFYCGCCMENGHLFRDIMCDWCKSKQHLENIKVSGERKTIHLCKTCHKPWIRNATGILDIETIRRGLREKWKRLQSV